MSKYDPYVTSAYDDPDPDGVDTQGILPLLSPYGEDEEEIDEDGMPIEGIVSGSHEIMGASKNKEEEDALEAEIEPGFREMNLPKGAKMPDDDPDGLESLHNDLSPGEAEGYMEYMRPLTDEEAELNRDPMFKDLRWVDDPAHTSDVLASGKNARGMDLRLHDVTYGDLPMKSEEELADRLDCDRLASWGDNFVLPKTYVPSRDLKKATVIQGLAEKMRIEHAHYLANADKSAGLPVRSRGYYEDVAGLWTRTKMNANNFPTNTAANWKRLPLPVILGAARVLLNETRGARKRPTAQLADSLGWGLSSLNPVNVVKSAYKYTVKMPTQYAYKYGVKMPTKFAIKSTKYVGTKLQQLALAPIKAIISRFTNKMVNRQAALLAKQRGLAVPGPAERNAAKNWAKQQVRRYSPTYGAAITSLMGSEYGMHKVDLSMHGKNARYYDKEMALGQHDPHSHHFDISGNDDTRIRDMDVSIGADEIGLSTAGTAGLIILGPIGLAALLTGVFKKSSSPAQQQQGGPGQGEGGEGEGEGEGEEGGAADDGSQDSGSQDDGSQDDGSQDDGSQGDDGDYESEYADSSYQSEAPTYAPYGAPPPTYPSAVITSQPYNPQQPYGAQSPYNPQQLYGNPPYNTQQPYGTAPFNRQQPYGTPSYSALPYGTTPYGQQYGQQYGQTVPVTTNFTVSDPNQALVDRAITMKMQGNRQWTPHFLRRMLKMSRKVIKYAYRKANQAAPSDNARAETRWRVQSFVSRNGITIPAGVSLT